MAIIVQTLDPNGLVNQIRQDINDGLLETWSYDEDGDFSHTGQWEGRGWFRPIVSKNEVRFVIVGMNSVSMTRKEYSVLHGLFIELVLNLVLASAIEGLSITIPGQCADEQSTVTFS